MHNLDKCFQRLRNECKTWRPEIKLIDLFLIEPFVEVSLKYIQENIEYHFLFKCSKDYPNTFIGSEIYLNNEKVEIEFEQTSPMNKLEDYVYFILFGN